MKPTTYPNAPAIVRELIPAIREIGVSEVARRSGLSQAAISHWVCGRRSLGDVDMIRRVADAAGYDLRVTLRKRARAKGSA